MTDQYTTWRDRAKHLLNNRPRTLTLTEIADEIGCTVQWLKLVSRGEIKDPSVNKIEALTVYLKKRNQDVVKNAK